MATKSNLELKVGVFAFISIIVLTLAIFSISEIHIFRPGYSIKVIFNFASGIDVGAPVRVAGVEVGEVKDIQLSYDEDESETKIVLYVWLDGDVRIPRDSRAYVNMLGLIGETYLEIIPGEDYAHLLRPADILVGRDPFSTETLMEVVHKVGDEFDDVLNSINDVLDEETKEALRETIRNFRDFSGNLKVITGRLERGEGRLGRWLAPRRSRREKKESEDKKSTQPTQNFGPR